MKHTLTPQRYLILLAVMLTASVGDTLLSHGMAQVGPVTLAHLGLLLAALRNPWVITGILCLLGFFASYLTALSWADLTFVLPATAFGYVVVAFLAKFWLHETDHPLPLGGNPADRLRRRIRRQRAVAHPARVAAPGGWARSRRQ